MLQSHVASLVSARGGGESSVLCSAVRLSDSGSSAALASSGAAAAAQPESATAARRSSVIGRMTSRVRAVARRASWGPSSYPSSYSADDVAAAEELLMPSPRRRFLRTKRKSAADVDAYVPASPSPLLFRRSLSLPLRSSRAPPSSKGLPSSTPWLRAGGSFVFGRSERPSGRSPESTALGV